MTAHCYNNSFPPAWMKPRQSCPVLAPAKRNPAHVMIVAHPMLGALLVFDDYDQGYSVVDDIGVDWDLSPHGYLKSRGHIVHTDDSWPKAEA